MVCWRVCTLVSSMLGAQNSANLFHGLGQKCLLPKPPIHLAAGSGFFFRGGMPITAGGATPPLPCSTRSFLCFGLIWSWSSTSLGSTRRGYATIKRLGRSEGWVRRSKTNRWAWGCWPTLAPALGYLFCSAPFPTSLCAMWKMICKNPRMENKKAYDIKGKFNENRYCLRQTNTLSRKKEKKSRVLEISEHFMGKFAFTET